MKKLRHLWLAFLLALLLPAWAVVSTTLIGNSNYQVTPTDVRIVTQTVFTAPRTLTLVSAGVTQIGQGGQSNGYATSLEFWDAVNAISGSNTLTITPASGETINGSASSIVVSTAGAHFSLIPVSGGNWIYQPTLPSGFTLPVSVANGGTNCSVASGTCLDNITGFASTGLIQRTGAGAYSFVPIGTSGATLCLLNTSCVYSALQIVNLNATAAPTAVAGVGHQVVGVDATASRSEVDAFANVPAFITARYNGTNASKTAVANSDNISAYIAAGWDGTAIGIGGQVRFYATQAWVVGSHGTKTCLTTTPNSSATNADGLCQEQTGGLTVNGATDKGIGTVNAASGVYDNGNRVLGPSNLPAVLSVAETNPAGTSSATLVMMGLGGATSITPVTTGRLLITIHGDVFNATAIADGASITTRYGTGVAPTNGAAVTGNSCFASPVKFVASTTAEKVPFSVSCIITGQTLSTALWIDLALSNITGGTATVQDVVIVAHEL